MLSTAPEAMSGGVGRELESREWGEEEKPHDGGTSAPTGCRAGSICYNVTTGKLDRVHSRYG